jgi:hypothetical protein
VVVKGTALARRDSGPAPAGPQLDPITLGKILAESGYFADARQMAQAAVKVIAGQELGLGPVAAMTGVHIVQGKVTLGANMIAALIRRSGRYDYRVVEHTDKVCRIDFYRDGERIGESSFSIEDAKRAGLLAKPGPWTQHPRNMLFARAISNGAKWHAPDVFAGPVYTPDELGAVVDAEGDVVSVPGPAPEPAAAGMTVEEFRALGASLGLSRDDLVALWRGNGLSEDVLRNDPDRVRSLLEQAAAALGPDAAEDNGEPKEKPRQRRTWSGRDDVGEDGLRRWERDDLSIYRNTGLEAALADIERDGSDLARQEAQRLRDERASRPRSCARCGGPVSGAGTVCDACLDAPGTAAARSDDPSLID